MAHINRYGIHSKGNVRLGWLYTRPKHCVCVAWCCLCRVPCVSRTCNPNPFRRHNRIESVLLYCSDALPSASATCLSKSIISYVRMCYTEREIYRECVLHWHSNDEYFKIAMDLTIHSNQITQHCSFCDMWMYY